MTYAVEFQVNLETELTLPLDRLRRAVEWVLDQHDVSPQTGLSIVFTDDAEIRRLNQQFRAVDAPTDVLSFPADEPLVPDDEELDPYLGDLVLALPYIQRQSQAERHNLDDELVLAVVHGTLHLLGYDHDTASHQAEMWALQSEALGVMDVSIQVPLFEFPDDDQTES